MSAERIKAFIRGTPSDSFENLALEAFRHLVGRNNAYRAMCERRGQTPETVSSWEEIPPIPTRAFKQLALGSEDAIEIFRSSGTGGERSVHPHPFPDLYRATIDAAFPAHCLPTTGRNVPMLSLIPSREQLPDSSLSFMIDHVMHGWGDDASIWAIGQRGVDGRALRTWLAARQRDGRPALLLTTAFALIDALESLERLGLRFRLPPGSVLFETGGYKGRSRQLAPEELEREVDAWLGIPADRIVREYGMTELTSQLYTRSLLGGPTSLYVPPAWVRVHCLDPESLRECAEGEIGLVAILDLANLGSALHLLTEDLGRIESGGLRLLGRASGADLRGCSLTAEELAASG
jgi:hypothetical protein